MFVPSKTEVRKWAQQNHIPLTCAIAVRNVPAATSLGTVGGQMRKLPFLATARVIDHKYDADQTWRKVLLATERDICPEAVPSILILPEAPGIHCSLVQVGIAEPLAMSTPQREYPGPSSAVTFTPLRTPESSLNPM
ncbi:hypothetical protein FKM82_030745 [Ascaphus truei]